jgi:hypothetical protein
MQMYRLLAASQVNSQEHHLPTMPVSSQPLLQSDDIPQPVDNQLDQLVFNSTGNTKQQTLLEVTHHLG